MSDAAGSSPFGDRMPGTYKRLRRDLAAFATAYRAYLTETLPLQGSRGGSANYDQRRSELLKLAVRASHALEAVSLTITVMRPPVAGGGVGLSGLPEVAFAHEDGRWTTPPVLFGAHYKSTWEGVLDLLDRGDAELEERERSAARRLRNPLVWIDLILRTLLGLPAYLLSLLLGFDRRTLPKASERLLWLFSVIADGATLYGFGKLIHWW